MTPPLPSAPGWHDDPQGRRRWWDGQRWGAYAPWDAPSTSVVRPSPAAPLRLDRRLLHDPTAPAHPVVHHVVHAPAKELAVAYLLLFFLGTLGAHRFYLGRTGTAVAMLSLTVIGAFTALLLVGFLPLAAVAVWWIVDLFVTPGMVSEENRRALPSSAPYERGWPPA